MRSGEAVKRGVDVRVMMPSTSGSDNPMVQHAGHRNFEKLLQCGVRLFEYPHTLLHQKVMTVDGVWSAIGSYQFRRPLVRDQRRDHAGDRGCRDDEALDEIFEKYVPRATEIKLESGASDRSGTRLIDNMYYMINEVL